MHVSDLAINMTNKIDEGAASTVYKITLRDKAAAVKMYKKQFSRRKTTLVVSKMRRLRHPNIVRLRGFSYRPSSLIFEYCHVKIEDEIFNNLSQLIEFKNENENFSFLERLEYFIQASQGVSNLHENGIVHKDIKPSNMLVCDKGDSQICIKISDFDDIVDMKNTIKSTTTHYMNGMTLGYTAPELCDMTVTKPSKSTDIYSLGLSFFEVFSSLNFAWSGIVPVLNDSLLLKALAEGKRPAISQLYQLYPEKNSIRRIGNLLTCCWSSDSSSRPEITEVGVGF